MSDFQFFNVFVFWTRSIVLVLSITVVVLSLTIYNSNSTPMLNLIEANSELQSDQILYDTIRDRRLIATLVAAQASIFCPLFLLMSSSTLKLNFDDATYFMSTMEICRLGMEQFCQLLMPLGLAFSWIFCITFDRKTEVAIAMHDRGTSVIEDLKYITIIVLFMEVLGIWIVSFKYVSYLIISRDQYAIRLSDDIEKETILDI